jgi:hypothetical protein
MRALTRVVKNDTPPIALTDQDIEMLSEPARTRTCWGPWCLHGGELRYARKNHGGDFVLDHQRIGTPGDLFSEFARVVHFVAEDPEDFGLLVMALRDIFQFEVWKRDQGEIVWGRGDVIWNCGEPVDIQVILRQRERLVTLARALGKPCPGCGKTTCGGYNRRYNRH